MSTGSTTSAWKSINCGVRQGCPLSPLLFNIYLNAIIRRWRLTVHGSITLQGHKTLDTLLYADDQVLFGNNEDELQYSIYHLHLIARNYNLEISTSKTKIMAFQGKLPVRSKICIENVILEQVNTFKYLGYTLTYLDERDISNKIQNYIKALRIVNQVFPVTKVQQHTRLRLYKVLARPVLSYGSEAWTIRCQDERRLTTAEMRFLRKTAGYSLLDHKRNDAIVEELKVQPVIKYLQEYRAQWFQHVRRMDCSRIPKQILQYIPRGKRSIGRPYKRWLETVTGH